MSLYHSQHLGKSDFYFWYGQVVGGREWENNHKPKGKEHEIHKRDDPEGWGYRLKVAIMGSDPRVVDDKAAKNSELAMAEVMLPTSGGGGVGGPISTPSIGNNSFVIGFYKDGVSAREPIIMGVLPNISQSRLLPYDTTEKVRYNATTGMTNKDIVPTDMVYKEDCKINESFHPHPYHSAHYDQYLDPRLYKIRIPVSYRCENELQRLEGHLQDAMNAMNAALGCVSDMGKSLQNIIDAVAKLVAAIMKILVTKLREITLNNFEKLVQPLIFNAPLSLRNVVQDKIEKETDILSCVFNAIIDGLLELALDFVTDLLTGDSGQGGGGVASTDCTVQSAIGSLSMAIMDSVSSAIDGALGALGALGNIANTISDVLSFIFGIFNILTCQEEYKCPTVKIWDFWYGTQTPSIIGGGSQSQISSPNAGGGGGGGAGCNLGPIIAGPPNIVPVGGNRAGTGNTFSANPVVSSSGQIIALDIINPGSGYQNEPIIVVQQQTGNGAGAVINPILEDGSIPQVVILDTGVGYLQAPNGGTGAGGLQFSNPGDTIIFSDGAYSVYSPNQNIPVEAGDLVYLPPGSSAQVYDEEGELVQNASGTGNDPITIQDSGIIGTPEPIINNDTTQLYPTSDNSYPVILELNEIFIQNPGTGYQPDDPIIIEPSNGAEFKPVYTETGALEKIEVISSGIGFIDRPEIFIQSDTGFNAQLIPILNVKRIGDLTEEEQNNEVFQNGVIEVIDCVGFIPPKKEFDIVPQ